MFCYIFRLSLKQSYSKNNKQSALQATTAQLYPGRDTFDFDHGHVTKNQPITVFILVSESLAIQQCFLLTIVSMDFHYIVMFDILNELLLYYFY